MTILHRVRLPQGAQPLVEAGRRVEPDEVLATRRPPGTAVRLPMSYQVPRSGGNAVEAVVTRPGSMVEADQLITADGRRREIRSRVPGLLLGYDADDGSALVAPLGASEPILGHVRGQVVRVEADFVELEVAGATLAGVGGTGGAVHGKLSVAVKEPGDELRAAAIDVGATGNILVGGSRASAETLTRARAMGVAGIVLGGVLDKELRDFEAIQRRRREVGGLSGDFGILLLEGFGKVGLDPTLFAWFRAHEGNMASLFGDEARLYVYEAAPPPARHTPAIPGERVVGHRRPFAGASGVLLRVLGGLRAVESGLPTQLAVVRFDDGRIAEVPLANLEGTEPVRTAEAAPAS